MSSTRCSVSIEFSGEIWDDQLERSFRTSNGALFERIKSGQWVQVRPAFQIFTERPTQ